MIKRCAIYTRKSTEEGLDQAFNSLDAQREACENYILSQKSEGWRAIKTHYDDGGLSGGNMERPALQALMQDIDDGKVDIIVVYKVDRLTRSLADFAKLVERFDKHDVSFVSVTQQFNTSNSMGRLTLNVLLSFAQFEREVGAERVRDKIAASRKKGIWTGGQPPLGYNNVDRKLEVVEAEANIVREVFNIYRRTQCVKRIIETGAKRGWISKRRANGSGGKPLSRGPIYHILKNPIYAGLIKGKDKLYEAQHDAIIARDVWEGVQKHLAQRSQWSGSVKSKISPLAGLLYWNDERLIPSHSSRKNRRHRYYISAANKTEIDGRVRLKARDVETAVVTAVKGWSLDAHRAISDIIVDGADASVIQCIDNQLQMTAIALRDDGALERLTPCITKIDLSETGIAIMLQPQSLIDNADLADFMKEEATIRSDLSLKRRGQELRLILGDFHVPSPPDETITRTLARAHRWKEYWFAGTNNELKTILGYELADSTTSHRTIKLAFLAPDIVEAFMDGSAPFEINSETLKRLSALPIDWEEQRRLLRITQK
ncbi:MAG: hypothetical protein DHS20C05_13730 [Hyphococcus sp.]|nr:MAG: hypothetical protein DHS20C05_13730 [Marinicaulis sp.]